MKDSRGTRREMKQKGTYEGCNGGIIQHYLHLLFWHWLSSKSTKASLHYQVHDHCGQRDERGQRQGGRGHLPSTCRTGGRTIPSRSHKSLLPGRSSRLPRGQTRRKDPGSGQLTAGPVQDLPWPEEVSKAL